MDNSWPPKAPDVNKAFKKASNPEVDLTKETQKTTDQQQLTAKQELEALEAKKKVPFSQLGFSPGRITPQKTLSKKDAARAAELRAQMQKNKGNDRDDFEQSM